eukprot:CAMPEP_0119302782 /NCGR_PEP_ID=MMETSP1333-20130426/4322_1 /TAXON_ID=418940 /ORGANISM="Scyphosphaera apsteinii, Strain RCC1455" /LENGTH=62 /DNA_ID=CAMNT_0007305249 /DNA_START=184 /DNA_END=372 /DNA_ORIENTATION=-
MKTDDDKGHRMSRGGQGKAQRQQGQSERTTRRTGRSYGEGTRRRGKKKGGRRRTSATTTQHD